MVGGGEATPYAKPMPSIMARPRVRRGGDTVSAGDGIQYPHMAPKATTAQAHSEPKERAHVTPKTPMHRQLNNDRTIPPYGNRGMVALRATIANHKKRG